VSLGGRISSRLRSLPSVSVHEVFDDANRATYTLGRGFVPYNLQYFRFGQGSSNGVNLSQFLPTVERQQIAVKLRQQFAIPSGARIIGLVGRLTVDKGVAELLDAIDRLRSQLPNLKLFVVRPIDDTDPRPIPVLNRLATDSDII
jgi:glycosyltransferase involved in cell wall biosynthesis